MKPAHEILEKWNFEPGSPPLPGRVARHLGELIPRFREGLDRNDVHALRATIEDLESLQQALELWTQVELDHTTLHGGVEGPDDD